MNVSAVILLVAGLALPIIVWARLYAELGRTEEGLGVYFGTWMFGVLPGLAMLVMAVVLFFVASRERTRQELARNRRIELEPLRPR